MAGRVVGGVQGQDVGEGGQFAVLDLVDEGRGERGRGLGAGEYGAGGRGEGGTAGAGAAGQRYDGA